ncbi:hypothetical protein Ahy_B05g075557 [Arachis hypogaea]|uniref:Uncharacterized protein n=1 Tax=Arachis hypogaea TaxID=3818 RepID=A0A444Z1F8_ARAHY|nr:hypothetical protein Ahy_B05g075557 [Arachis hypogaea]
MTYFKNKELNNVFVNTAYLKSRREFAHYFGKLRVKNVTITNWLEEIPREQWTHYADEGRRFGHMITNIYECINVVMIVTCSLLNTTLVKSTYFRLGELFAKKGIEAQAQFQVGTKFSQTLMKAIEININY